MIDRRRPRGVSRQRAVKSARPLGLHHPAGTKNRRRPRSSSAGEARTWRRLDLTQILTLGAVLATLALAVPQFVASQATLESTRSQSLNTQQQQITERFGRAVEQLGTPDNLEVRIGGIYALERIARDSQPDHPTVVNVLTTFVRENTKALRDAQGNCPDQAVSADVQTALTVLARRNSAWDTPESRVDFTNACLQDAKLPHFVAPRADLRGADLSDADLGSADLSDTNLSSANLIGADLSGARLSGTNLSSANLSSANLIGAKLSGTRLINADLSDAHLSDADLSNANLSGAKLSDAYLGGANLAVVTGLTREQVARIFPGVTDVRGIPPEWLPQ
ncbi:pentapeptide repeat-containing protein [Saccharopolyspora sp. 5N708]|uniref:pentapeptide repeat-containing protein n=1 Tax=Saccharopolyspora sp. 5N708 TaxID=3457424 RepID=UPI003FCF4DFD